MMESWLLGWTNNFSSGLIFVDSSFASSQSQHNKLTYLCQILIKSHLEVSGCDISKTKVFQRFLFLFVSFKKENKVFKENQEHYLIIHYTYHSREYSITIHILCCMYNVYRCIMYIVYRGLYTKKNF